MWLCLICTVCSGFHLLTCSTLLLSTFAFPLFLRPNSTLSETNTKAQLGIRSVELKEEEEPIVEERKDNDDPDSDSDSDSDPTQECSDGSISDEESLIEIALPSGFYIDSKKPLATRCGIQQKYCYEFESFKQKNLMAELLAEINEFYEEDNMIEIDLSMGSIKCPRFEIRA
ncbi:hypothetical protein V2J09_020752 [Rumex salicifolius]